MLSRYRNSNGSSANLCISLNSNLYLSCNSRRSGKFWVTVYFHCLPCKSDNVRYLFYWEVPVSYTFCQNEICDYQLFNRPESEWFWLGIFLFKPLGWQISGQFGLVDNYCINYSTLLYEEKCLEISKYILNWASLMALIILYNKFNTLIEFNILL